MTCRPDRTFGAYCISKSPDDTARTVSRRTRWSLLSLLRTSSSGRRRGDDTFSKATGSCWCRSSETLEQMGPVHLLPDCVSPSRTRITWRSGNSFQCNRHPILWSFLPSFFSSSTTAPRRWPVLVGVLSQHTAMRVPVLSYCCRTSWIFSARATPVPPSMAAWVRYCPAHGPEKL